MEKKILETYQKEDSNDVDDVLKEKHIITTTTLKGILFAVSAFLLVACFIRFSLLSFVYLFAALLYLFIVPNKYVTLICFLYSILILLVKITLMILFLYTKALDDLSTSTINMLKTIGFSTDKTSILKHLLNFLPEVIVIPALIFAILFVHSNFVKARKKSFRSSAAAEVWCWLIIAFMCLSWLSGSSIGHFPIYRNLTTLTNSFFDCVIFYVGNESLCIRFYFSVS